MATFKLILDDFQDCDYDLIAIHSVLEDYRLAYFLNKNLPILLSKSHEQIVLKNKKGESVFRKYCYEDNFLGVSWTLIQNLTEITTSTKNSEINLFQNEVVETEIKNYILPELKSVDFFLKIDHSDHNFKIHKIVTTIGNIYNVSKVYHLKSEQIKSKNNLIF